MSRRVVALTRPSAAGDAWTRAFEEDGFDVLRAPLIEIRPPADRGPLEAAIAALGSFDVVAFTSARAADAFLDALEAAGGSGASFTRPDVFAVGRATAARLEARGVSGAVVPTGGDARALAEALAAARPLAGARVLLPLGDRARRVLPDALRGAEAAVTEVVAYRTVAAPLVEMERLERALLNRAVAVVCLASGSAVDAMVERLGAARARAALGAARRVSLGGTATAALERLDLAPDAVSERPDLAALRAAVRRLAR